MKLRSRPGRSGRECNGNSCVCCNSDGTGSGEKRKIADKDEEMPGTSGRGGPATYASTSSSGLSPTATEDSAKKRSMTCAALGKQCSGNSCTNCSSDPKKEKSTDEDVKPSTSGGNSVLTSANAFLSSVVSAKKQSMTCGICLEVYTEPKILPCFHTFCRQCLEKLPNEQSAWLPYKHAKVILCPTCRKRATVPSGGVSQFQSNFHIISEDLEKLKESVYCASHPDKEMDLYCASCEVPSCVRCMLSKHKQHDIQELAEVLGRKQLIRDRERLKRTANQIGLDLLDIHQNQLSMPSKRKAFENTLKARYNALIFAVNTTYDEMASRLADVADDVSEKEKLRLLNEQERLEEAGRLQERVTQALGGKDGSEVVMLAKELRSGSMGRKVFRQSSLLRSDLSSSSLQSDLVEQGLNEERTTVGIPVLNFGSSNKAMLQNVQDYFGSPAMWEVAVSSPELVAEEKLWCREDRDISHVCPLTDGKVWVSYEPGKFERFAFSELRDVKGKVLRKINCQCVGRITWVRRKNGKAMMVRPTYGSVATFAKRVGQDMSYFFRLNAVDYELEKSSIQKTTVTCDEPLKTERTKVGKQVSLKGFSRALDFSSDETMFVVLDEVWSYGKRSSTVHLYECTQSQPLATYEPPSHNRSSSGFLPSDVCFYKLGGQEVLLVADEQGSALHVVNIVDKQLKFSRHLQPHSKHSDEPLRMPGQPLALNTDAEGRLWVACRGGKIFVCTPVVG